MAAETPKTDAAAEEAAKPTGGRLARLRSLAAAALPWAKTHYRLLLAVNLGAVIVIGVVGWLMTGRSGDELSVEQRLAKAMQALNATDYNRARYEAELVNETPGLTSQQVGTVALILGTIVAREAEKSIGKKRKARYLVAARYLEQAHDRGYPKGYDGLGEFLLGKSLFESGQLPASRPILRRALANYPQRRTELHRLLATAYMTDEHPLPEKAKEQIEQYLAEPRLSATERGEAMVTLARILFRMQNLPVCLQTLEQVPQQSGVQSQVLLLKARVFMRQAESQKKTSPEKANALYRQAIALLRQSQERDTLRNRTTPKAMFLIGVCLDAVGEPRAALAQWERVRKLHFDTPEGLAATIREAEQLQSSARMDEALGAYRDAVKQVGDTEHFRNPWISLASLRSRMLLAYDAFLADGHFQTALELVAMMRPLFPSVRLLQLEADAHQAWGQDLVVRGKQLAPEAAKQARREAYVELRRAGAAFRRLADARRITRYYADDLWHAASSYLRGKAYSTAAILLEEYLEIELRQRRPQALVAYGEALLAEGRLEPALKALDNCLELYARDAASFDARLLAAQARQELGQGKQAEQLLLANLEGDLLTPASRQWRKSLLAIGRLYHLEGRFDEALDRLDEFVARYGKDPSALEARYLAALSARRKATKLTEELDQEKVETARQASLRVTRGYLERALKNYTTLQTTLNDLQALRPLSPLEAAMLRNCYLSRGATLVDLQRYEAAIDVYATATNRYQHEPVALEAYVQIAHCYQRLNRPLNAQGVLAQAKIVLDRMPQEAAFDQVTNFTRQQWQELLDSLRTFGDTR